MLSYIMENNESKRRQMYEECRESIGIGVSKLPEKPEVACRDEKIKGDLKKRALYYGSAAVIGILIRILIKGYSLL